MKIGKWWAPHAPEGDGSGGGGAAGAAGDGKGGAAGAGASGGGAGAAGAAGDAGKGGAAEAPDWRVQMVGPLPDGASEDGKREHEALTKLVGRYTSPAEALRALRAAQVKFSSGQVQTKLPANATAEQIKEWRADNGIPEEHSKYDLRLDPGVVLSAEDKTLIDGFLKDMHGAHARPEHVSAAVQSYLKMRDEEVVAMVKANKEAQKETQVVLSEEWGPRDYQANMQGIDAMLVHAGKEVSEAILGAADADGVALINNPAVARWFAGRARELGFVGATLTPGGDLGASLETEKDSLIEMMNKDPEKYYGNEKNAKRLMEIVGALERQKR